MLLCVYASGAIVTWRHPAPHHPSHLLPHHPSHLLSPSYGAQVLNFAVPDQLLVDRITGRWVHPASGRSYHGAAGVPLGLWLLRVPCLLTVDLRNQLRTLSPHCYLSAHASSCISP